VVAERASGRAAVAGNYSPVGAAVAVAGRHNPAGMVVVEDHNLGQVAAERASEKAAVAGNYDPARPAVAERHSRGQVVAEMWEPKPRQPADRLESGFHTHRKTVRPPREVFRNARRTVPQILLRFVRSRRRNREAQSPKGSTIV
jgi:hypothetical protein